MYFNKYPYSSNFEFLHNGNITTEMGAIKGTFNAVEFTPEAENTYGEQTVNLNCQRHAGDIYYINISSNKWTKNYSQSELELPDVSSSGATNLTIDKDFNITLKDKDGNILLESFNYKGFGISGNESIYIFNRSESDRFYGMGEKMGGLEKSGKRTKFWNADVWADFPYKEVYDGTPDPMYVSVPYLIIKRAEGYVGLLLDNAYATYMDTVCKYNIAGQMDAAEQSEESLCLGAEHGQPNLIIIYGPSLHELTCKLQKIVGVTPLPPAWSLGYHQCRWGYESYADLKYLDTAMNKFKIPCDALWLDIEYMRGYRVFTFEEEKNFPDLKNNLKDIQDGGRRIIPIIDPGVKAESGYEVYDSGKEANIFCKNPQGQEFIGIVWPGETAFPDYSTEKGRSWWSAQVETFAKHGITGAWLDMNDPAVGPVLCNDMLFNDGKNSHYTFHNQYAMGMAKATHAGFASAYPEDRPFLLSRSGFTGSSKYTAIWTGDNISNYHYLKASIPCTLNLALSGIPFNGPDAGGFGENTSAQLMVDWFKAGFLFPFFRNHSIKDTENQEPWAFDTNTLNVLRHYIRMRYYLRPYLYNLFAVHEETGAAIMRPLFYEFDYSNKQTLDRINDQFMIGPAIMQAPFVEENETSREVILPAANWYSPMDGKWLEGSSKLTVEKANYTTPIYFREGAIVPMAQEVEGDHEFDASIARFHLFFNSNSAVINNYTYIFDDGQTYGYREGKRSRLNISVKSQNGELIINTTLLESGYGDCKCDYVLYGKFDKIMVNGKEVKPEVFDMELAGNKLKLSLV